MKKAVFWDFDGTLTFSDPLWTTAAWKALGPLAEQYGVTFEKVRPFMRAGFPWHPDGKRSMKGEAWWEDRARHFSKVYQSLGVPAEEAAAAARRVRERILSGENYRVRPDAAPALALSAYKGYRNYLLSNNYPELEEVMEKLYLRQYFSGCVVSGKIGINKPDPRIFQRGERMARSPDVIWMVGDNPQADIEGAKAAGWKSAWIVSPEDSGKQSGATVTVNSLMEFVRYL